MKIKIVSDPRITWIPAEVHEQVSISMTMKLLSLLLISSREGYSLPEALQEDPDHASRDLGKDSKSLSAFLPQYHFRFPDVCCFPESR